MIRIKTLDELGSRPSYWNQTGKMDYLYGKIITEYREHLGDFIVDRWNIKGRDVIKLTPYKEIPKDVTVGQKFVVVSDKRMSGTKCATVNNSEGSAFSIGQVVELVKQDFSSSPGFILESDSHKNYIFVNWGCLAPYSKSKENSIEEFKFEDKAYPDEKQGSKYIMLKDIGPFKKGSIVTLDYNDESGAPRFTNDHETYWVSWPCVRPYLPIESSKSINLKTDKDVSKETTKFGSDFNPELFLRTISPTYACGSTPVGVEIYCSREEILLGS